MVMGDDDGGDGDDVGLGDDDTVDMYGVPVMGEYDDGMTRCRL